MSDFYLFCESELLLLSVDQLRQKYVANLERDLLEQSIESCLLNAFRKILYALDVLLYPARSR